MKIVLTLCSVLTLSQVFLGQEEFVIRDASRIYDVKITVEKCNKGFCEGKTKYGLFKKTTGRLFQNFDLDHNEFSRDSLDRKKTFQKKYLVIYFKDLNFDGIEDLALHDGFNGGYHSNSWQVFLYSTASNRFVHSQYFTKLTQGPYMGFPEIDKRRRILKTFEKSGAGNYWTEEYDVIRNRPRKIKEVYYYLTDVTYIETKKLINGKWRTWVKTIKGLPKKMA